MPFRKAFLWILLSTIAVSGSVTLTYFYLMRYTHHKSFEGEPIRLLLQTVHGGDPLDVNFLSGVLDLSEDFPTPLNRFNLSKATEKLLQLPMISRAKVTRVPPEAIHLELTLRTPLAYVGDYHNTVVDAEGKLFPLYPYYTPKTLPVFFLGEEKLSRASNLLQLLENHNLKVKAIDLTRASDLSFGRREILVWLDESHTQEVGERLEFVISRAILRLDPENVEEAIHNYLLLRTRLGIDSALVTIDLRLPDLAFIKEDQ